jgi:hypothetical protein
MMDLMFFSLKKGLDCIAFVGKETWNSFTGKRGVKITKYV